MLTRLFLTTAICFLGLLPAHSQLDFGHGFGGQVGLSCSFGTHINRVGFIGKFYYAHEHFQINLVLGGWWYGTSLGTGKSTLEGMVKIGALGAWGAKDSIPHPFVNEVSNQTGRRCAAGYSYNIYFNQIKTSQVSGTLGLQFYDFRFIFENDFMGFSGTDKYRTGALALYYRIGNIQFGINHVAWTGDPYVGNVTWVRYSDFPSRYGYMDMSNAPYGEFSAGVFALHVEAQLPYGQYVDVSLGADAEQIRNFFQNRLIHDSPILPINWGRYGNPHIPMVRTDGRPYTYKPNEKIRAPRFYAQFGLNSPLFY